MKALICSFVVVAMLLVADIARAQSTTWTFSGTISHVIDPNSALSSSGVQLSVGDSFVITWTYDPTIGPTIVNSEVAQWQCGTNRSSMVIAINGTVWESDLNFNDQVFDNGSAENVISGFRTDLCSTTVTPLSAAFTPTVTATSWAVHATGRDAVPDLSWPNAIDLTRWDGAQLEIFEEGLDGASQFYTYSIFGDISSWSMSALPADEAVLTLISQLSDPSLGLSSGEIMMLNGTLQAALASIQRGRTIPARHQLVAFLEQVQALQRVGRLIEQQAVMLITAANSIIASLQAGG
jgi:hypothetical protein